jgi:hypothetical protein
MNFLVNSFLINERGKAFAPPYFTISFNSMLKDYDPAGLYSSLYLGLFIYLCVWGFIYTTIWLKTILFIKYKLNFILT